MKNALNLFHSRNVKKRTGFYDVNCLDKKLNKTLR